MQTTNLTGFVALAMLLVFLFAYSVYDWYYVLCQAFYTPGRTKFFPEEKKYWPEGWTFALNCVNHCLRKYHLSCVQDSRNSINGLCWWQKPQQESSSVTSALTWQCNPKSSFFNINVEHVSYCWNAFEPLKPKSIKTETLKPKEAIRSSALTPWLL